MKKILLPALLLALCAFEAPFTYSRTNLPVLLAHPPAGVNARLLFDTEIRDAASIQKMPGWYSFASMGEASAAMIIYDKPTVITVGVSNNYAPVDILMLDTYGMIEQIAPNIVPAELQEPIVSDKPMSAMIYLKGGAAARFGVQPGDHVEHALFKKRNTVLTAPAKDAPSTEVMPVTPATPAQTAAPVVAQSAETKIEPKKDTPKNAENILDLFTPAAPAAKRAPASQY